MAGDMEVLLVPNLQAFWIEITFAPEGKILPKLIQSRWVPMKGAITAVQKVPMFQSLHLSFHRKAVCKDEGVTKRGIGYSDQN